MSRRLVSASSGLSCRRRELHQVIDTERRQRIRVERCRIIDADFGEAGNKELNADKLSSLVKERATRAPDRNDRVDEAAIVHTRMEVPDSCLKFLIPGCNSEDKLGRSAAHIGRQVIFKGNRVDNTFNFNPLTIFSSG